MKEQEAKELEHLVGKVMEKAPLETPSFQFTDKVMAAINAELQRESNCYRPLISRYVWAIIAVVVIGFTAYIWFLVQPAPLNLPTLSFDFMEDNLVTKEFAAFKPSKITIYGVLLLAVMLCIQIPVLKRYFDGRV
ncbi:MAG: hypothetical protein KDC78_08000 [Aequorivita sp.]|nr:hypothetical protein [Aequorivita sp.]